MKNRRVFIIITGILFLIIFSKTTFAFKDKKWISFNLAGDELPTLYYPAIEGVDIDFDGDMDLFLGTGEGYIAFMENKGNPEKHLFTIRNKGMNQATSFLNIKTDGKTVPRFIDIDGDNDYDLFFGNNAGNIGFYRNEGDINTPKFVKVNSGKDKKNSYFNINVGLSSAPFFVDIDNDNDYDLFIGNAIGHIAFYKNEGNPKKALFVKIFGGYVKKDSFNKIDVGEYALPFFSDLDHDDHYDLFIGNYNGQIYYYKNIGTSYKPKFQLITDHFAGVENEGDVTPCFLDIDNSGSDELFIGDYEGTIITLHHPDSRKIYAFKKTRKKRRKKQKRTVKKVKINQDKIWLDKARSLIADKDYIEAAYYLEKIDKHTIKSKKMNTQCEDNISKLYKKLKDESFLFTEVKGEFEKAVEYYIEGDFDKSIVRFNKVLASIPYHKVSKNYRSRAEKKIKQADDRKKAEDFYSNAEYQYNKNNFKAAFQFIKRAVRLDSHNAQYLSLYTQYSNEYFGKKEKLEYDESIKQVREQIQKKQYDSAMNILISLKEKHQDDETIEDLIDICTKRSKALRKSYNSQMKKKYAKKGDNFFIKKDYAEALKNYELALKYSPSSKVIKNKIKKSKLYLSRKKKRKLNPKAVKIYFQKGLKYYTMGDYKRAISAWNKVLEIDPKHVMARKNIQRAKSKLAQ